MEILEDWANIQKQFTYWYATSPDIPVGRVVVVEEGKYHPRYFIIHPDNFEKVAKNTPGKLAHIRDYVYSKFTWA